MDFSTLTNKNVSSVGKSGKAKLTISAPGTQSVEIDFSVKIKEDDNG